MALRRNILIFHLSALGDFVLTWPLALALGRLYPQSRVFYVTHGDKGRLAEKVLRVESTDIEAGWHHLFGDPAALPPLPQKLLAGAHTIVSFLAEEQAQWTANVRKIAAEAAVVPLSSSPPAAFAGHLTEWFAQQLEPNPVLHESLRQMLRSVTTRGVLATPPPPPATPTVVIHPGAGSPTKCWPAAHFLALARRLSDDGMKVRVLLGEVEIERWSDDIRGEFAAAADVRRPAVLLDLLAELQEASAFVGNDSGPGHLSGMIGKPTVTLLGPSSRAERWSPLGPRILTVAADSLDALDPARVHDAVRQALGGT